MKARFMTTLSGLMPLLFTLFTIIPMATVLAACGDDDDETSNTDNGNANGDDDDDSAVTGSCPPCPAQAQCIQLVAPGLSASQLQSKLSEVKKEKGYKFFLENDFMLDPLNGWVYEPGKEGAPYCMVILPYGEQDEIKKLTPPTPEVFMLLAIEYMKNNISLVEFSEGGGIYVLSSYTLENKHPDQGTLCSISFWDSGERDINVSLCTRPYKELELTEETDNVGWVMLATPL